MLASRLRIAMFLVLASLGFMVWPGADVSAEGLEEAAKINASDSQGFGDFGRAVDLSGNVALIGAPQDSDGGNPSGSAYVYRFDGSTWVEEQKLRPSDGVPGDEFGFAVAVSGDVALVGSLGGANGSAYVYRFNGSTWVEEQKLTASDAFPGDGYGFAVSLDGDVALIGARLDGDNGPGSGSAYVYRFDGATWIEEQKLLASDGSDGEKFGFSVSIEGDMALIGANGVLGAAYVYRFDGATWTDEVKLTASDGDFGDSFGTSARLSGNVALIGAPLDQVDAIVKGSTYVYRFDGTTWTEEQKLFASDGAFTDDFGVAVAISGDVALIAARSDDDNGPESGSAYVYRFNGSTWTEAQKLVPTDGAAGDQFGFIVALDGEVALIGAPFNQPTVGAAYVFVGLPDCTPGTVNAANGIVLSSLFINGDMGGDDRTVELTGSDFVDITVLEPIAGGNGKFTIHANVGSVSTALQTELPFDLGSTCFPFFLTDGASPVIVANNIGKTALLGENHFYGAPLPSPERATTTFSYPPLPIGLVLTWQGVIIDPGSISSKSASTTNAVTLRIVP